ncbi:MAG TPA: hypothetical protein VFH64_08785 [Amnibacterium sp.]|nr:hypothetical protein [Amnibacterium sp.]
MTPYRRALADPVFRRAVEEHYAGRHPVLDALRWFEGDAGEEGPPSPYEGLEARRAALYRPDADEAEAARVAALLVERDEERAAVLSAVEAAEGGAHPVFRRPPEDGRGARRALPAWAVLLLAVPAVIAAFVAGTALGPVVGQRVEPPPSVTAAQAPEPVVVKPTGGGAVAVFARPQQLSDVPTTTPDGDLIAQSFRRLAVLRGPGVVLYGAQTTEGQICLVAITIDTHITATCSRDADFRLTPCSIDMSVTKDPESDDPRDTRTEIAATWSYNGALRASAVS